MKKLLLISVCVCLLSCKENQKSISLIDAKTNTKSEIILKEIEQNDLGYYNDVGTLGIGLIKPISDSLTFYKESIEAKSETVHSYNPFPITPIFYKPDYGITYLVCIDNTKEYYKIKSIQDSFYLKKTNYVFVDWRTFLINSKGIGNIDGETNPIKKEANVKSENVDWLDSEEMTVVDIKNEWTLVKNEHEQVGWIKWREKDKLLIEIYLLI